MIGAKKTWIVIGKVVALTAALFVVQAIGAQFLTGVEMPAAEEGGAAPPSSGFLALVLAISLAQTVALVYPALRSRWHGWRLALTLFALYFGPVTFLSQIESVVYLSAKLPAGMIRGLFLMGLFNAAVFAPLVVLVLGRWRGSSAAVGPAKPRLLGRALAIRLVVGAAVFLSLYYLFGYYVAWKCPVVRDYYGGTDPGSFLAQMSNVVRDTPWMLPFQLLRGLVWMLLALPVVRMMRGRWWEAGLALSLLFGVPALYLLYPNPLMPDPVRWTHFTETLPYQFLFGWFAAWLLTRGSSSGTVAPRTAAAGMLIAVSLAWGGGAVAATAGEDAVALPGWELVWADEFDGEKIDPASWTSQVMPDPHNEELQYYPGRVDDAAGANAWLENGALVIEARSEKYEHRSYTSARLKTQGKREFLYGRFEARIRQPGEVGMWPAFWLLGANIDEVGWPRCGEIDIMEGKGRLLDWTSSALHRGPDPANNQITSAEYRLPAGSFHDEWHVFAVEWEPRQIRWEVDGVRYQTVDKPADVGPAYWPFDEGHPFFIILNLAVGGWFDKGHPPPEAMEPQRLYVDYVRVYRAAEGPPGP